MLSIVSLLSTLFLVSTVLSSPTVIRDSLVRLPLSRRINLKGRNLLEHDQARARAHLSQLDSQNGRNAARDIVNQPITNAAVGYLADVAIGSPATTYHLLLDTGSSNTWVGATQPYARTNTSTQTSDQVQVIYGSGSMSGTEFTDQVSLGAGLTISQQSIGVATSQEGLHPNGVDGILGLGPAGLTLGTLSPDSTSTIPTVTDNLFSQGHITSNQVGISFAPTTSANAVNGELTWGGTDSTKYTGSITYTPITTKPLANEFWGIDQSVRYGTSTNILSTTSGIVDTGTTLFMMASDAFQVYQAVTGGELDEATGLLTLTPEQFSSLQSLFFTIGGTTFEFTANAQIWPRALNSLIGGDPNQIYLIVGNIGTPSGSGVDFVNGQVFHERFYTVYDTANKRVGFATTPFTNATTN